MVSAERVEFITRIMVMHHDGDLLMEKIKSGGGLLTPESTHYSCCAQQKGEITCCDIALLHERLDMDSEE